MKFIPFLLIALTVSMYGQQTDSVGVRSGKTNLGAYGFADTTASITSGKAFPCRDCLVYFVWKAGAADTIFIEQHVPVPWAPVYGGPPQGEWKKAAYKDIYRNVVDTSGLYIFNSPFGKIQVIDSSPGTLVRFKKRTLVAKPTYYIVYEEGRL
jgi:hypothetical protein